MGSPGREERLWLGVLPAVPDPLSFAVGLAAGVDLGFSQVFITGTRAGAFLKQDLESRCRKPQLLQVQAEPESQGVLMG